MRVLFLSRKSPPSIEASSENAAPCPFTANIIDILGTCWSMSIGWALRGLMHCPKLTGYRSAVVCWERSSSEGLLTTRTVFLFMFFISVSLIPWSDCRQQVLLAGLFPEYDG